MSKKIFGLTFCFIGLLCIIGRAQVTFNLRYFELNQSSTQSIHVLNDGYLAVGNTLDTTSSPPHTDLMVHVFSNSGELLLGNHYGVSTFQLIANENSFSERQDLFSQASLSQVNDTVYCNVAYLDGSGDTLFTSNILSPYINDGGEFTDYILPKFTYLMLDSSCYVTASIGNITTFNDAVLYKLDPQGHELWHYVHATLSDPDAIFAVVPHQGGVIYAVYHSASPDVAYGYHEIIKRDNLGGEVWTIDSRDVEQRIWTPRSILIDNDSIVVSGSSNIINPTLFGVASIYKIDTLGNLIWSNTYGDYTDFEWRRFTNVVQTTDGNYVCGGTWTTTPGSEPIPINHTHLDFDQFAHIVKFNRENGEIIWERKYRWLETYRDFHTLRDMKATPDGGVIFCGEALDLYLQLDPPYQQGWVVKLDACGCLVPGCDEGCSVSIDEVSTHMQQLKVGPNPATDFLNVFLPGTTTSAKAVHASLQLFSLSGQLLQSFPIKHFDTTYVLDVSGFASAEYVLVLEEDGVVVARESIAVR